jgi:hypothetical protein
LTYSELEYGSLKPQKREGAGDLDQAVFMSDVSRKQTDDHHEQYQDDEENVQSAKVMNCSNFPLLTSIDYRYP